MMTRASSEHWTAHRDAKRTLGNYKHAWSSSVRKSASAPGASSRRRRWRGGRRTRRKMLISTRVVVPHLRQSYGRDARAPGKKRDATIDAVQPTEGQQHRPFDFANKEQARVIAGEEEAAYAWVAVNFVDGALLEATDSPFGTATPSRARGSMEMGGSSAQISFYKPEQDILAGLFKLQLGGRSHINIYAHSFLHYGRVSSRRAYWEYLAKKAGCWTYDGEDPQAACLCD